MLPPASSMHCQVLVSQENPLVTAELIMEQQIKPEGSKNSMLSACNLFGPM